MWHDPAAFVAELLDGLLKAHPDMLGFAGDDPHGSVRADAPVQGKVALALCGGSGHLPVFLGSVGTGVPDGCAEGDMFASPSADQILDVTKRIHGGAGVLYISGNYGGDMMNFALATKLADMEDIAVRTVLVKDAGLDEGVVNLILVQGCGRQGTYERVALGGTRRFSKRIRLRLVLPFPCSRSQTVPVVPHAEPQRALASPRCA